MAPASEDEQAITDAYSEKVKEELTAAYVIAEEGEDSLAQYETGTAAWDGFVRTIKELQPPGDVASAHNQMVSIWERYVEDRKRASRICNRQPALHGLSVECVRAMRDAQDGYLLALYVTYEATGMTYDELFSKDQ